jgi:hypothetical protein
MSSSSPSTGGWCCLWKKNWWLIEEFATSGCISVCVLFYLSMLVSEAWLPISDNRYDLPDAVVIWCILYPIWMETNMCWHLLWCMNSLEWWYASLLAFLCG